MVYDGHIYIADSSAWSMALSVSTSGCDRRNA